MNLSLEKRITANLPRTLLEEAQKATGKGITETLVHGLELIRRSRAYEKGKALQGKVQIDINLKVSRERSYN